MTKYDDAQQGMTDRRRTGPDGPRRGDSSPLGRRVGAPDVIDGEVVAVEVHDDPPATPSPGRAAGPRDRGGRRPAEPAVVDGSELQDSLDQIERLAAELKEIAEVITPSANSAGRRSTPAADTGRPPAPASQPQDASGTPRPAGPSTGRATVNGTSFLRAASTARGDRAGTAGAEQARPGQAAPRRTGSTNTTSASATAPASAAASASAKPAGPRFEPHNAPPPAAGRPMTQSPMTQSPATPGPEARPVRDADDRTFTWLGPEAPLLGPSRPAATGRSVVREPLPPEPKRRADEDLVFGADPGPAKPTGKAATTPTGQATAKPTGQAATTPTGQATATPTGKAATAKLTGTRRVAPPRTDSPRAQKTVLGPATTGAIPLAEFGVTQPATASDKFREKGPADRSAKESRGPAGRSNVRRGRYTAIIIGAFALAVPAFALGAVQPWNTSTKTEDKLSVAIGDRAGAPPLTGGDPSPAVPNASPSPSVASVAPLTPEEVTAGQAGEQPRTRLAMPAKTTPPTHRNSHPVGLALSVYAEDVRPTAGESVRFKLTWKDGSGHFGGATQQWGDGSPTGGSVDVRKCTGDAPQASGATEVTHTFQKAGTYTVRLSVTTYTCDGRTETQTVPMTITVQTKPSPSPTSTPTPTESPKDGN